MADWETTRRSARAAEVSLERLVQEYGLLAQRAHYAGAYDLQAAAAAPEADAAREEHALADEIEQALSALSECTERMQEHVDAGTRSSSAPLLQRYREILFDYSQEFRKATSTMQRKRESAELFAGVRDRAQNDGSDDPATEQLLRERNAISNSLRSVSDVLNSGAEVAARLRGQRGSLTGASAALGNIANTVPSLGTVIAAIQRRRNRDNVVLSCVIAGCILFTLYYLFA